jgi:hypothetical protein
MAVPGIAGDDSALYLRMRLLRLHGMNRILYQKRRWAAIEKCLIEKTSQENVAEVERRVLPATFTEEAARDAEFALVGHYGHERYADAILLRRHINETLIRFRVGLLMDVIYRSCGYDSPSKPEDLLDSAAWHAGQEAER